MSRVPNWYQSVNIIASIWIWSEFIIMLTNKKRRALHDFMAGTVVIRSRMPNIGVDSDAASPAAQVTP